MTSRDPTNVVAENDKQLEAALANPAEVLRLELRRVEDARLIERVAEFTELISLSVSMVDCRPLAPHLSRLEKLNWVSFQRCWLGEFPAGLLNAIDLTDLRLGNNSIKSIPAEIEELSNLKELWLSQNQLTKLPDELFGCPLKSLNVSYNQLTAIPDSISKLSNTLEVLLLSSNQLPALPGQIDRLQKLRWLTVDHNKLTTLPEGLVGLGDLEGLSIMNNPFISLPGELEVLSRRLESFEVDSPHRWLFMDWSWKPSTLPVQRELDDMHLYLSPNDSRFAEVAAGLKDADAEMFVPRIRDTISIDTTVPFVEEGVETIGCSRFGGFPDLTDESQFPMWENGKTCYVFLGQINLADIAELNSFLPRKGLLSFFLSSLEDFEAKVVFHEGDLSQLKTIRFDPQNLSDPECDNYTENPHRLSFKRAIGVPYGYQQDVDEGAYEKFFDRYPAGPSNINGHTFTQHESPEMQAANELGGRPEEWVCLLEVDSHMDVDFCFWDAGTITFAIHREDLRRNDFSRVHGSLESS